MNAIYRDDGKSSGGEVPSLLACELLRFFGGEQKVSAPRARKHYQTREVLEEESSAVLRTDGRSPYHFTEHLNNIRLLSASEKEGEANTWR